MIRIVRTVAGLSLLALGACNYERLPTTFHLAEGPARAGLTVMYTESMRDPANAAFPPVTVRLISVGDDSMPGGRLDLGKAIDAAAAGDGSTFKDVALNQRVRLVMIPPDDPLFASPHVLGAAFLAWAGPEEPRTNYIERVGVFDDKGNEISQYVAAPQDEPPAQPDRRAALISTDAIRGKGVVIEVDREGVKIIPSTLRLGEARATPAEDSK